MGKIPIREARLHPCKLAIASKGKGCDGIEYFYCVISHLDHVQIDPPMRALKILMENSQLEKGRTRQNSRCHPMPVHHIHHTVTYIAYIVHML
jgi:hypothetical protein